MYSQLADFVIPVKKSAFRAQNLETLKTWILKKSALRAQESLVFKEPDFHKLSEFGPGGEDISRCGHGLVNGAQRTSAEELHGSKEPGVAPDVGGEHGVLYLANCEFITKFD